MINVSIKIDKSEPLSIPQVMDLLTIQASIRKLSFSQLNALKNVQTTSKLNCANAQKLVSTLNQIYEVSIKGCITLANCLPVTKEEIQALLIKESKKFSNLMIKKIINEIEQSK